MLLLFTFDSLHTRSTSIRNDEVRTEKNTHNNDDEEESHHLNHTFIKHWTRVRQPCGHVVRVQHQSTWSVWIFSVTNNNIFALSYKP